MKNRISSLVAGLAALVLTGVLFAVPTPVTPPAGGGGGGSWGLILGTLSDQTDLANALAAKQDSLTFTGALSNASGTVSIADAVANGTTKGAATFTAADFNDSSGLISIDYTNGQAATASVKGFLTSTDWSTFNNKVATTRTISTTTPLAGGGDLSANRNITIADAVANGTTKGAATFTAADFNDSSGVISIDYTNAQAATSGQKGFLTSTDWSTFNAKAPTANPTFTGTSTNDRIDFNKLVPLINNLGTITNGSTATLTNTYSVYKGVFSGQTATIALPASPADGVWVIHGNSTYSSGTQTITVPALVRPEYDMDSTVTSFTVPSTTGGYWTAQFAAVGGSFVKFSVVGDTLGASSGTVTATGGSLTSNLIVLGAGSTDTKVAAGVSTDGTSKMILGVAGTSVGSIDFKNATSGTLNVAPPTGALGTINIVWPNASSTLPIFGQQITFTGPTVARTITLPDSAFTVAGLTVAQKFTASRVKPRINTITSSATPTTNTDNYDVVKITALAAAITSMTTNLTGAPDDQDQLLFDILDNGTARAITWGASFEAGTVALPITTTVNKHLIATFIYQGADSKWACVSSGSYQ